MNLGLGLMLGARGGATFSPSQLAGVAHWYRADLGITISTGVSQWNDQVGTAHLIQATGANQPAYNATDAAYNNLPTVQSTATNQFLAAVAAVPRPFAIWFLGQVNSLGLPLVAACGAVGRPYLGSSSGNAFAYTGTAISSGVSVATKRAVLATFTSTPTRFIGADNWLTGGTSDVGVTVDGDGTIAAFAFSDGTFGCLGKIAELIFQAGIPTAAEKTAMAAYIFTRYGITIT